MFKLYDTAFKVGFSFGILLMVLANFYTSFPDGGINRGGAICFDCYETWGFPFAMHESGTILHLNQFIWAGVVANISVAIVFSFISGLILRFVWSKFKSKSL